MFSISSFIPEKYETINKGQFVWSAPSNIALVKYWGKKENQIPANASVSFTLKNCKTITTLSVEKKKETTSFSFDFLFDGKPKERFIPKITQFFNRIEKYCPYLKEYHLKINTKNTFPHSSGIASSASGMAALSMTIMALEKEITKMPSEDYFYKKASFLARLGSGSACRSIKGRVVAWGEHKKIPNSTNLYGVEVNAIHPNFKNYQDAIILVDKGEKQVSSTVGHQLMHNHLFAQSRFHQAFNNLEKINECLITGDVSNFIKIVESEALTLHAMMMTSMPYFLLMKPNTLAVINKVWEFREHTKIPICFTLDAGANVHILYPEKEAKEVLFFINKEIKKYCQNNQFIIDEVGEGVECLN